VNLQKSISAKKAWAALSEKARLGEKFGFIACLGLLYKSGIVNRQQVIDNLNAASVTPDDLRKFRERRDERETLRP
jgi:hypothetical protein